MAFGLPFFYNAEFGTRGLEPYIVGLEKTTQIKIGLYPGTSDTRVFQMYTGNVKNFDIVVESFSDELQLMSLSGEPVEKAPCSLFPTTWDREAQFVVWGFKVTTPPSILPGEYSISLAIKVSNNFFSKEYIYIIRVVVEPLKEVLPLKSGLKITLDKETYFQGETMQITIKNILNETIWFTDTACNLYFERFNGACWEFYDAMIGGAAMTPLQPNQTRQFTWKLGYGGLPYPSGRYRVGTKGVYAEFEILEAESSLKELKNILIKFLNTTTDVHKDLLCNIEILEVYNNKLGGQIIVINYTTLCAGHPHFMCEAIEHHTAIITLNNEGEAVSAFCVWGGFHDGKTWDLVNQRWIQTGNG